MNRQTCLPQADCRVSILAVARFLPRNDKQHERHAELVPFVLWYNETIKLKNN